jgi:hypothetical protein
LPRDQMQNRTGSEVRHGSRGQTEAIGAALWLSGGTAGRDNNRRSRAASLKSWPEVRLRGPPARPSDRSGLCATGNAIRILTSPIKVTLL